MGECWQQKHPQHAPSTKTECDYLNGWIKKRSHAQKSHPKVVNPRDIAGERRKKEREKKSAVSKVKSATVSPLVFGHPQNQAVSGVSER